MKLQEIYLTSGQNSDKYLKKVTEASTMSKTDQDGYSKQKRQIMDILDVRGKLAIENDEKVVYVKCHYWLYRPKVHPPDAIKKLNPQSHRFNRMQAAPNCRVHWSVDIKGNPVKCAANQGLVFDTIASSWLLQPLRIHVGAKDSNVRPVTL